MSSRLWRSIAATGSLALLAGLLSVVPAAPAAADPEGPQLREPSASETVTGNPVFEWAPAADAVRYRFQLSTSESFASTLYAVETPGLHATPPTDLPVGTMYWRVAGIDLKGVAGPFSSAQSFHKASAAAPVVSSPAHQATLSFPADAPVLRWQPAKAPGIKEYEVELDDAADFIGAKVYKTSNTALAVDTPLTLSKDWHWRVRGVSMNGVTTAWSTPRSFELVWRDGDGRPRLLTPADGTLAEVTDVKFTWAAPVTDATSGVPGAQAYEIEVSPNGDWANNVIDRQVVKGTQYAPTATYGAASYFWRVRALAPGTGSSAATEAGPWSQSFSFRRAWTRTPVPTHPVQGRHVTKDELRFEWDGVDHASYYSVEISTDPNFGAGATTTCSTLHTSLTPHTVTGTRPPLIGNDCTLDPQPGTVYHWRVTGFDAAGSGIPGTTVRGVPSGTQTFTYDEQRVELLSPLGTQVSAPVLRWEPLPGYHKYEVTMLLDGDPSKATTGTTHSTSWSPVTSSNRLVPGNYLWWVNAVSTGGQKSPTPSMSSAGSFTLVAPDTSPMFSAQDMRADDGGNPTLMPSLTWTPIEGAASYRVWRIAEGSNTAQQLTAQSNKLPFAAYTHTDVLTSGTWRWYVEAFGANGALIASSPVATFTVTDWSTPRYSAPTEGTTGQDVPQLRWLPSPQAYEYRVHLALDANFTNKVREYRTQFTSLTPREFLPDNQAGASYFWYVQVCKSTTVCGPGPEVAYQPGGDIVRSFRKVSPAPVPLQPAHQSTVGDQVAFSWQDYFTTSPGAPGAKLYRVQVATDELFAKVIDSADVDQPFYAPHKKVYPDGVYYWRVQALEGTNQPLTPSQVRTFTKSSAVPANQTDTVSNRLPTLRWDATPNTASYTVEVYRGTDASFPQVNRVVSATSTYPAYTLATPLLPGEYSWRVRKNDVDKNPGQWTAAGATFTVSADSVALLTPKDSVTLESNDILFTWSPVAGASSYRFETSTSPGFASTSERQDTISTSWASPRYHVDGTTYHWRVTALDPAGGAISTSAPRSFVKNTVTTTLTSSANPARSGDPVVLTATVRGTSTTPTGTVDFRDGETLLGSSSLSNGSATYTVKALSVGSHTLTATWRGNSTSAPSTSAPLSQTVTPSGAVYRPVAPERVMAFQPVGPNGLHTLTLKSVPAGATAVAINVTAALPTANTWISVCPGGTPKDVCKTSSNINPYAGQNTPNMVVAKLGAGNTVSFYNDAGNVQLIADLQGWFVEGTEDGGAYQAVSPTRVLDFKPVQAGTSHTLRLSDVPAGATAVALNVTAASPTTNTWISVCPGGTPNATCRNSSNLNPYQGFNTPNAVIVKLGPNNEVTFYNESGTTLVIADLQGWFVDGAANGSTYRPVEPHRQMSFQTIGTNRIHTLTLKDVPAGATAVLLNVTAANPTAHTWVSVCPGGTALSECASSSNLNPYPGQNVANMVVAKIGTGNRVSFYNNNGSPQVIADVQGWFLP